MNQTFTMKKLKSLLFAALLCAPLTAAAQDIEINAENFPDEKFHDYLLAQWYGEDGIITESEIKNIEVIDVSGLGISNLKGIEHFTNLLFLDCSNNLLTELDASAFPPYILEINCSRNQIKGEAMDALINSLPMKGIDEETGDEFEEGLLYIYDIYYLWNDGNICTKEQVSAIKAKKWRPLYFVNGRAQEYKGFDPTAIAINETNFPDERFRDYLIGQPYGKDDGALSREELDSITYINVSYVSSLKGIEHFTALKVLECGAGQLTELDLSKNTALTTLTLKGYALPSIDLSKNTALETLTFNNGSSLTSLDLSNRAALKTLKCEDARSLTSLNVSGCTALTTLECGANLNIASLNASGCTSLITLDCSHNRTRSLNLTGCTALTTLDCRVNSYLMELDLSTNTALKTLLCSNCDLTELDLSNNTALATLDCRGNALTALNLSGNTALTTLDCQENNYLTSIDVSGCTALTALDCKGNSITSIDVSGCIALTILDCQSNQIKSLDLSGCTALTAIDCGHNQIAALDISECIALDSLNCRYNQIATLDLSNCPMLTFVDCEDNELIALNVPKHTILKELHCGNNQFTTMDLSDCTSLTTLYYSGNTSLDVSGCTSLTELTCGGVYTLNTKDGIPFLNISGCTALTKLDCDRNELTSLDISDCTALTTLDCSENYLTSLDISNCKALTTLICNDNYIKAHAMEAIISNLPDNPEGEMNTLIACQLWSSRVQMPKTDTNVCTASQVRAARLKGWKVGYWQASRLGTGSSWVEYGGSADLDPNLSGLLIDSENFPDPMFRIYLLQQSYGEDGLLTEDEVKGVTIISAEGRGIKSLDGIEHFTELTRLDCYNNKLTALDLSKNTALSHIDCSRNQIKEEAMDALINSLPSKEWLRDLYIYDTTKADEGNVFCTKSQATAAKARGWTLYYTNDRKTWFEFESDDEAAGIVQPKNEDVNAPVYNLSGQKVTSPVKGGIYIVGGKKVVVK